MEDNKFLTISYLNNYLARMFEANPYLDKVYLKGEISNFKWSGKHCYFSLKDDNSEISAMMFSYDNQSLTFEPRDGMNVQVMGKIQVYQKKGTYAIIVKKMAEDGIGLLYQEFLELKDKLFKEGLFDQKYKKPLPNYPKVVAVITSPTGDAVRDIISTFNRRLPLAKIIVYPALVQGKDAPSDLVRALKQVYNDNLADCLIIGRGGGSFEDLSCFNDEELARTLFNSPIPTVTGIGHEADYTICDFVSSFRAPTPTGAAIALTKEKNDCYQLINTYRSRMKTSLINNMTINYKKYESLVNSYAFNHFDELLDIKKKNFELLVGKLNSNSPINVLNQKENHLNQLDIKVNSLYNHLLNKSSYDYNRLNIELINQKINYILENKQNSLDNLIKKLIILNPLNIMERGYSVIYQEDKIITKLDELKFRKLDVLCFVICLVFLGCAIGGNFIA